jgi:hypothetical protein
MDKEPTHLCKSELEINKKKLDGYFFPIEGKSEVAIIHEYKKTSKTGTQNTILENALWQVYANHYLNAVLLKKAHKSNKHCTSVYVRGIVFFQDEDTRKWGIVCQEFQHSIKQAKELCKKFPIDNKELLKEGSRARERFLKKWKSKSLENFISKYSMKPPQLITGTQEIATETSLGVKRKRSDSYAKNTKKVPKI